MEQEIQCVTGFAEAGLQASLGSGAIVSGFKTDTEETVIGREKWQAMHDMRSQGKSISAIAREFDIDRKTVRATLRKTVWAPYVRTVAPDMLLDAHRQWLEERAPKVNYSARILWQELRGSHGFAGSYETVKRAVQPLRQAANVDCLTQRRFETGPAEQAQVDWGQVTVPFSDVPTKIHIFIMTLGYSRRAYAEGFFGERLPDLLAAHERAFAHFGGCCDTLLYDRPRTIALEAVMDDTGRRRVRLNPTFEAFASHWGFTVRLCRPYRAQTKGKVESGVKYVKRNFIPGRTFRDLEDFNVQLFAWQAEVADVRVHGTTHERPIDRFAQEAKALTATASQPSFLQAMVRDRVVADDWLVSIDGNRYSVPFGLIGKTVQVVREGGNWVIRHAGRTVAQHAVTAGRGQFRILPEHGPGAAARNTRHPKPQASRDTSRHAGEHVASLLANVPQVEIRDLALYDQLALAAIQEVGA